VIIPVNPARGGIRPNSQELSVERLVVLDP
jgi:hypothetical protein